MCTLFLGLVRWIGLGLVELEPGFDYTNRRKYRHLYIPTNPLLSISISILFYSIKPCFFLQRFFGTVSIELMSDTGIVKLDVVEHDVGGIVSISVWVFFFLFRHSRHFSSLLCSEHWLSSVFARASRLLF